MEVLDVSTEGALTHDPFAVRLRIVGGLLAAAMAAGIAMSWPLWAGDRGFPLVPSVSGLPAMPQAVSIGLTCVVLVSMGLAAFLPRSWAVRGVGLGAAILLVLFDQNRLQPWVYQYLLMVLALGLAGRAVRERSESAWALCALIVASIYFWSGLQKGNAAFGRDVLPWLLEPLRNVLKADVVDTIQANAWAASVTECLIGLALMLPPLRGLGILGAWAMHASILHAIGPWGHDFNSVVWPWNLAMMAMVGVLFFRQRAGIFRAVARTGLGKAVGLAVGVLPALSFVNLWDDYLSASLYSGRMRYARIVLAEDDALRVAERFGLKPVYGYTPETPPLYESGPGQFDLDVTMWSYAKRNVPPYPEIRYLKGVAKALREAGVEPATITVWVTPRPRFSGILQEEIELPISP